MYTNSEVRLCSYFYFPDWEIRHREIHYFFQNARAHECLNSGSLFPPSLEVLVVKNLPPNAGDIRDASSTSGSGRFPGGGHESSLQDSCLEDPMDGGAWQTEVHSVTQSQTRLRWLCTHVRSGSRVPLPKYKCYPPSDVFILLTPFLFTILLLTWVSVENLALKNQAIWWVSLT